jgi:FKBP-type peptidyl-prolyl cis-trans isomerase
MKMKQLIYLILFLFIAFSFASCNDDKIDEAWKDANWEVYTAIRTNPEYTDIRSVSQNETGPTGVYYKELKKGTGTEHPLQTSAVTVLYSGKYYNGIYFDAGTSNNIPISFSVASTVRGFSFALQNMVVGDKWEIVIPYYLGYGTSGSYNTITYQTEIPGYTTLFFEVELVSITTYPNEQ